MVDISEQSYTMDKKEYSVAMCVLAARNLVPFKANLKGFYTNYYSPCDDSLLSFVDHMKRVESADMSFPVVLSPDGVIIDGRHRLCKALMNGDKTLLVVQLETMPTPIKEVE